MSAIAKTVWLIESRFRDALTLDDLAAHAGVSRSHLSRIFPLATGYSISAYLRGRRLSEAAKALAGGAPDILGVALDYGYGSHEAFTRAFREQFDMTPDELRRRRDLSTLPLVEALRMDTADKIRLDPARIEDRPALKLSGLSQHYDSRTLGKIPDQWARFAPFIAEISGGKPGEAFGVIGRMTEGVDGFDYFTGIPADPVHGLVTLTLPAMRYARIAHHGHVSNIRATCAAIFEDWLPGSGYEQRTDACSFLEYYGPDFNPVTGLGTIEIWVGLR